MRGRLERVGGTLTIESAPGGGTTLNAAVPLAGPDQEGTP
jgi:signal transduction histidine kinase